MPYPGSYGVMVIESGNYSPYMTQIQNTQVHNGYYEVDGGLWMHLSTLTCWTASAGTGNFVMGLPTGWQIDTARLSSTVSQNTTAASLGFGRWWDQGSGPKMLMAYYNNATTFIVNDNGGGIFNLTQNNVSDSVGFHLRIPVKRL